MVYIRQIQDQSFISAAFPPFALYMVLASNVSAPQTVNSASNALMSTCLMRALLLPEQGWGKKQLTPKFCSSSSTS